MHQQQGCRVLALGHRYRAWAMAWCLTGIRPLSISKMTLCIPMKLAICIAWKYQHVWHMSVICKILYLGWIVVRLQNLQCFSSGDAAAFRQAIDVHVKVFLATIGLENGCTSVWLKYRCLNQRWLFFEYSVWIILGKPWMITAEIPWYLQIYVLGPVTGMFPGIQPMSWADLEPAPDWFLSGFGTLCCV